MNFFFNLPPNNPVISSLASVIVILELGLAPISESIGLVTVDLTKGLCLISPAVSSY